MALDLDRTTADGRAFYASQPYAVSHPDRLATVATLAGMEPASPLGCRLLELGCADGGNIIPLAEIPPESQLVGVDQALDEIRAGQETIQQLGLTNIELRHGNIEHVEADWGQFDFIICHGVFS